MQSQDLSIETGHNEITTIIGRKGQGKTVLAKSLINQFKGHVFIFDFLHSYSGKEFTTIKELVRNINIEHVSTHIYRGSDKDFFFNTIFAIAGKLKTCMVVLDEIHIWYDRQVRSSLTSFFQIARHRNINIIAVSQRVFDMPPALRALTDTFYFFNIIMPADLQYIDSYVYPISTRIKNLSQYSHLKITIS